LPEPSRSVFTGPAEAEPANEAASTAEALVAVAAEAVRGSRPTGLDSEGAAAAAAEVSAECAAPADAPTGALAGPAAVGAAWGTTGALTSPFAARIDL